MGKDTIEQHLLQIVNMLLLNGTSTGCPGLVHGKMGIAIFFFHYAKSTDNMLFADYAMDLITETLDQIHVNTRADYEKGIAGIGVAVDYMIRNQFLVTEEDLCEDFDQRMVRAVLYDPWQDFSMYDGLTGYGRYWMTRLHFPASAKQAKECLQHIVGLIEKNWHDIPKEEQTEACCFVHELQQNFDFEGCNRVLRQCNQWDLASTDNGNYFTRLGDSIIGRRVRIVQYNRYFGNNSRDGIVLLHIPDLDMEKPPVGMGVLSGYAGEGLLRMTMLGQTDKSWMFLL